MESDILRAGWEAWRRNPVTAVPFVLHGLSVIAVSIATLLSAIYAIMPELPAAILSGDFGDEAFKQMFGEFLKRCLGNIELLGVTFVFGLVIVAALAALFKAWWIKLCYDALEGKAILSTAFHHAKSLFVPLFKFELILTLLIGIAFIPLINLGLDFFRNIHMLTKEAALYYVISFMIWSAFLGIFAIAIQFLFTFVPYAIVIDLKGTLSGIRRRVMVLRHNLVDTIIMWLLVGLAGMALQVAAYPFRFFGFWGTLAGTLVAVILGWVAVMPITTCWWVELYRRRSKTLNSFPNG